MLYREAGFDISILNQSVEHCRQLMVFGEGQENRAGYEPEESKDEQEEAGMEKEDSAWQQIRQP